VKADSLILGPVTLRAATAELRFKPTGARYRVSTRGCWGSLHGTGTFAAETSRLHAGRSLEKLNPVEVGKVLARLARRLIRRHRQR